MTWFAHKIVIFDIFKDVKAWGRKTEKNQGRNQASPKKQLFFFFPPSGSS